MSDVATHLFKQTRGGLQGYGSAPAVLKVALFDDTYDPAYDTDASIDDLTGEITGGTYARTALTFVSWDADGDVPALKADDPTITGVDDTVAAYVVYDETSGDLVADGTFAPQVVSGSLPIEFPDGTIATSTDQADDLAALQARTVAGIAAVGGDYPAAEVGAAIGAAINPPGDWTPITLPAEWTNAADFLTDPTIPALEVRQSAASTQVDVRGLIVIGPADLVDGLAIGRLGLPGVVPADFRPETLSPQIPAQILVIVDFTPTLVPISAVGIVAPNGDLQVQIGTHVPGIVTDATTAFSTLFDTGGAWEFSVPLISFVGSYSTV